MAQDSIQADVVIVGAGPTGLTIANLLGGMGVSVALVERNLTTVQEPRAVSIDDESMRTMQAMGLHRKVEAIVASGYGSHYYSPSGKKFIIVEPTLKEYGFEKRNGFQQPELEALLREGLSRYPNVRQFFGWEFGELTQDSTSVSGTIRNGETGETRRMTGQYLVASDGGRSPIRTALNVELKGSTYAERWLIIDLFTTKNRFRHTEVFCDPERPCITLPGPSGIRRYEFMLFQGEDEKAVTDRAFARQLLARVGPDAEEEIRRIAVYTFHARIAERWRIGRVLLAGDAAHLTPPFAGQGMNAGLRDASNIAWKLAEVVRNGADDSMLDSYQVERGPHAREMIELAMRMGKVMMPHTHFSAWAIRTGFRILGLYPPAREYFAQMKYKPKPRFRAGLFWPDGRDERETLVGRMIPQPVVEDKDRIRALLDDYLPDAPVVLVFDEFPDRVVSMQDLQKLAEAGVQVIGITPEWMNPVAADFPIYRDVTRLFSAPLVKTYLGKALLLRRDRYVAAVAAASSCASLVPYIEKLGWRRQCGEAKVA